MQLKTEIIIGILVVIGIVYFLKKSRKRNNRIQLLEIESVISKLLNGKLEHDFFAITTDGINRISFIDNKGKINIEFMVKTNKQKPYAEKFINFAINNNYILTKRILGNKNPSELAEPTVFYRLEINADKKKATKIGIEIMKTVFDKNESTKFDIFP